MIGLLIQTLLLLSVRNIGKFDDVRSLTTYFDRLYVGSTGGLVVYDILNDEVSATLTGYNVELATPDPTTSDIYFVSEGSLYRWTPGFSIRVDFIGVVGLPLSLGVGQDSIYLQYSGFYRVSSKFMFSPHLADGEPSSPYINWSGQKAELSRDDPEVSFLIPFFEFVDGMGHVHYTVIHRGEGRIWVGTDGDGVRVYRDFDHILVAELKFGIASDDVRTIAVSGGTIWLGGAGGITAITGRERRFYVPEGVTAMKCDLIRDISAKYNDVWAATDCNLLHYSSGMFWAYNLPDEPICLYDRSSELLIGTSHGLYVLDHRDGTLSRGDIRLNVPVKDIDGPRERQLMVLTSFGTYWLDDSGAHRVIDDRGWLSGIGFAEKWVGDTGFVATSDGLLIITESSVTYENPIFDPSRNPVHDIEVTGDRIWFATRSGLYIFDRKDRLWDRLTASDMFPQCEVYAVEAVGDSIYVGTAQGLSIVTDWR